MEKIQLKTTSTHEKGIFATKPIKKGELIIIFQGPRLKRDEVDFNDYHLQIGEAEYIGPSHTLDDYINHSCLPNSAFAEKFQLIALRDIASSEEITWDYSTSIDEDDFEGFPCGCQADQCRGTVKSFRHLSESDKQRLYPHLLPYLKKKYYSNETVTA